MPKIFFQASLPRAGSTLLQNLIGQNPDFYVTPTSGMMELIYGARHNFTECGEFKYSKEPELLEKAYLQFCNTGLQGYVSAITDKKYYLDKGRSWGFYLPWLEMFMPYQPKVICMIRDLRDVFASMENAFRKQPHRDILINWPNLTNVTVPKRIDTWANTPPVGIAIERIESIIQSGYANKILFVKYEDFCLRPELEMNRIYNYLEVPPFQHNFDYIAQITDEDDAQHDGFGDHIIRDRLELQPSKAMNLLGPQICDWIYNRYNWFYQYFRYNK
jgi:sulfotransferase